MPMGLRGSRAGRSKARGSPTAGDRGARGPEQVSLTDECGVSAVVAPERRWGLRVVCLSDTHGNHRDVEVPAGDVLVHAGDFTMYGCREHADDFDSWLAEQPHRLKVVVVGNHESSCPWNKDVASVLPHATVLRQSGCEMEGGPSFFGTDFFRPCKLGKAGNPYFEQIPKSTDVLVAHGPALGCADGGHGCPSLLAAVRRTRPALVVSGHMHWARGAAAVPHDEGRVTLLVNAANSGSGEDERRIAQRPIVVDI